MPTLTRLTLTDTLRCEAGTQAVYGVLYPDDLDSARDVLAVDDQESLTFVYARVDRDGFTRDITAEMRAGRVVTVTWDDDSFDEWRVGTVTQGRGQQGRVTVTCVPLWLDLVERSDSTPGKGWVSELVAGVRGFEHEITELTPTEIWDDYIIPNCPTWVTAGTVEPTYVVPSLSVSRLTPGGLALLVRDTLRAVDVACEVRLRRDGTSGYLLDLVTAVGASANVPVFHPSVSLLTLTEKSDPTLQATRVLMKGGTAPDGLPGQWGVARWLGGAPSGLVIALTDPNGGASPIAFDGQFVDAYLLRVLTGRTFLITASDADAGTVTLASVSTIAAGESFEFRYSEPLTNTRTTTTRYAVSAIPDAAHITCGVSVPITVDDQYIDWYAKVWDASSGGAVVITTRIGDSVAATDVLTVASSAGVLTSHYVEFVQLDGAGEIPCYIDHPDYALPDPDGYGIKVAELSKKPDGITQIAPNAWMRAWANGANPPDDWTKDHVAGGSDFALNRETTTTRYGTYAWGFTHTNNVFEDSRFISPPTFPNWTDAQVYLSVRTWVQFSDYSASGARYSEFAAYARTATGGIGALLGSVQIQPVASSAGYTVVDVESWIELKIEGITLAEDTAPYGVVGTFTPRLGGDATANAMVASGFLDVIEFYPFVSCPSENLEHGDATALLQSGNEHLRTYAAPPLFYTFTVYDLESAFPDEYDRLALTLGGDVRAVDTEYDMDATVRLLKLDRDLLNPADTVLTLANRPTKFTALQSKGTARTRKVIEAVNSGATGGTFVPPFVQLAAALDLPTQAEISVPSTTVYSVTLPTVPTVPGVPETTGASVTITPPDPTTAPTVVVTVGRPPSRRKPQITDEFY
jgi:hypothetical protein